ncbi:MAG: hypothetical protein PHC97_00225 [Patescibacteria group bacterium]|nr:hypothetical protein [Patescibacteria group bacterium]
MKNIEEIAIGEINRKEGASNNPDFLEKIQAEWNKLKPKIKNFSDVYPAKEIAADSEEIEKLKEKFAARGETAIVGESVIMEGIYEAEWIAEGIEVLPTSEYDDIKNGIDFVLRLDEKDKPLYLGVDVTTSTDYEVINAKRENILNFLRRGELGRLKYFEDQASDIKGRIELPKIAVVLSSEAALKMQDLMLKIKEHKELSLTEETELEKVRESVEKEVTDQLQKIIDNIDLLAKQSKFKKEKYKDFQDRYQEILNRIKKEALS